MAKSLELLTSPSIFVPKAKELYFGMQDFEAPYLQERLETKSDVKGVTAYETAFDEFKKYASLSVSTDKPLAMTSPEVDEVWHQFILFTRQYESFCEDRLGGTFLHHSPYRANVEAEVVEAHTKNIQAAYEAAFGEAPELWRDFQASMSPCDGCSQSDGGCSN